MTITEGNNKKQEKQACVTQKDFSGTKCVTVECNPMYNTRRQKQLKNKNSRETTKSDGG